MKYLLTAAEMSACDSNTSTKIGIPSLVLMERAALETVHVIMQHSCRGERVSVICGRGNNGGDGAAAARMLTDAGYEVSVFILPGKVSEGSSLSVQLAILEKYGLQVKEYHRGAISLSSPDIVVDALFGTGLSRDLAGSAADAVLEVNALRKERKMLVVSVDIPSGVSADDGRICGWAVSADFTVTYAFYKRGHFVYPGSLCCGKTLLCPIGITERAFESTPQMFCYDTETADEVFGARPEYGHKGTFGKILLVAGTKNMCGAAILAAKSAAAAGAGMVKVFTREENRVIIQEMIPAALLTTYSEGEAAQSLGEKLKKDLAWADVCAIGPGLGQSREAGILLDTLLKACGGDSAGQEEATSAASSQKPKAVVIDADALRLLSQKQTRMDALAHRDSAVGCILTPHMGEFCGLLHKEMSDVSQNRVLYIRQLSDALKAVVAAKDARTLVAGYGEEKLYLNVSGNSGMATAGSGDVLTGMTAAFAHQAEPYTAACMAVWLHGRAGDLARERLGERSMTAEDLLGSIPEAVR